MKMHYLLIFLLASCDGTSSSIADYPGGEVVAVDKDKRTVSLDGLQYDILKSKNKNQSNFDFISLSCFKNLSKKIESGISMNDCAKDVVVDMVFVNGKNTVMVGSCLAVAGEVNSIAYTPSRGIVKLDPVFADNLKNMIHPALETGTDCSS